MKKVLLYWINYSYRPIMRLRQSSCESMNAVCNISSRPGSRNGRKNGWKWEPKNSIKSHPGCIYRYNSVSYISITWRSDAFTSYVLLFCWLFNMICCLNYSNIQFLKNIKKTGIERAPQNGNRMIIGSKKEYHYLIAAINFS